MSKILSVILTLSVIATSVPSTVFSEGETPAPAASAETDLGSYKWYSNTAKTACERWKPGSEGSLVTIGIPNYPAIGDPSVVEKYKKNIDGEKPWYAEYMQPITDYYAEDSARIQELVSGNIPDLDKDVKSASLAYKARMSNVFTCGMIKHKIRVHENLLKTIQGERPSTGNLMQKLNQQTEALRRELSNRKCTAKTSTEGRGNNFVRTEILKQTTFEYCYYRHFLQYLKFNTDSRLAAFIQSEKERREKNGGIAGSGSNIKASTVDTLASAVAGVSSKIAEEDAHTREVFPVAFTAYVEFERTYAPHVALLFVLEDYVFLRDSLKQMMNPLGQVIYKASNAQSPKSPK